MKQEENMKHNALQKSDSEEEKKLVVNDDQVYRRYSVGDMNLQEFGL